MMGAGSAPAYALDNERAVTAYVLARAADGSGNVAAAADAYGQALQSAPDNGVVALRTYRGALAAGDMALALKAEAALEKAGVAPADGALLVVADRLSRGDRAGAKAVLTRLNKTPFDFMAPVIGGWIDFDGGAEKGLSTLTGQTPSDFGRRYSIEALVLMELGSGQVQNGVEHLQKLGVQDPAAIDLRFAAARLLLASGHDAEALTLIGGDEKLLAAMRKRWSGDKADAKLGVAGLYSRLAGELTSEGTRPLAIVLARAALILDPRDDRARLVLADALSQDGAIAAAKQALAAIPPVSPLAREAQGAQVLVQIRDGDAKGALTSAAALSRDGTGNDARIYADLLLSDQQYQAAAQAYALARQRGGAGPDWALLMAEGGALERGGNWAAGLPLLQKAVAAAPDEPLALNYLGYAQIERGENVKAALKLLEHAHELKPADLSVTDSLGWAYFVTGDTARALPLIEQAARGQTDDVTIREHLGDIYWTLGRRFEARYAWRAAAVWAKGADATRIAGKIDRGLTAKAN